MDFVIDFIKDSWPVFFCLYAVHQIEILDWLAEPEKKHDKDKVVVQSIVPESVLNDSRKNIVVKVDEKTSSR